MILPFAHTNRFRLYPKVYHYALDRFAKWANVSSKRPIHTHTHTHTKDRKMFTGLKKSVENQKEKTLHTYTATTTTIAQLWYRKLMIFTIYAFSRATPRELYRCLDVYRKLFGLNFNNSNNTRKEKYFPFVCWMYFGWVFDFSVELVKCDSFAPMKVKKWSKWNGRKWNNLLLLLLLLRFFLFFCSFFAE